MMDMLPGPATAKASGADLLWRCQANRKLPVLTALDDGSYLSVIYPARLVSAKQRHNRLQSVVRALAEQDRRCLYLRAEGLRYREIAEVLGISLGGVSNSLARSLARIREADEGN